MDKKRTVENKSISLHSNLWKLIEESTDDNMKTNRSAEVERCIMKVYAEEGRIERLKSAI